MTDVFGDESHTPTLPTISRRPSPDLPQTEFPVTMAESATRNCPYHWNKSCQQPHVCAKPSANRPASLSQSMKLLPLAREMSTLTAVPSLSPACLLGTTSTTSGPILTPHPLSRPLLRHSRQCLSFNMVSYIAYSLLKATGSSACFGRITTWLILPARKSSTDIWYLSALFVLANHPPNVGCFGKKC